jgi:exonuclease SbcC
MLAADLTVQQAAARVDADGFRLGKARADEVLAEGLRVKGLLDQRDMALVDRQALEARTGEMAAVRVEAERGRAALGLQDAQEEATRRVGEWQTLNEALAAAQIARARAVEAADAARTRLEAEKAREPQQVANQRQATLLEGLVDKAAGIAQARAQLDDARLVAEKAGAALDAAHQALESLAAEVAAGKAALDDAERRGATLEAGELASQKAVARLRQRQELETARKTLARAETDHGHARQALEVARGKYQKARDALDQADEAMREGAAGLLAKTLKDGEPCPVCGSASHPVPAHGDENLPDPKVVEDLRRNLRKLEEEVAAAGERENALQAQVAASQARVELILGDLGPLAETDVESLERECSEAAKRVADANAALRARDGLVQAQADRETRHSGMVAEIEVLRQQSNGAVASLKAAGATVDEREKTVPEAWRDPAVLELERQRLARELAAMKTALDKANAAHQGAVQNLASCDARVKAATSASDGAKALADQRREAFLERVAAAGFESEGAYTEARRTSDELAALDSRVESWTQALAAARDRRKRADDAAGDLTRPDMDALGKAAAQAGQDLDLAVETASRLAQQVDQKRKTIESLRKDAAAMEAMELEYGVLGSLSEAANGNNSRKITFQRYVLGALLDDVLVAATTRLKQMTGGRYLLQRVGQVGDRRRLAGLDLEVMDTYTGINRPVGTLSGGESFMAALSLALGMADVVQSYSGGIRLETIFIDEGFGSLDPEALDQALRELVKLKEGGRLVGIISHVPELKQRIDARLEVSADRTGSHARFVVG